MLFSDFPIQITPEADVGEEREMSSQVTQVRLW
jgi:hypothetical protein